MPAPFRSVLAGVLLAGLLAACSESPSSPVPPPQAAVHPNQPIEVPLYEQFDDFNYCDNMNPITYTMEGTARIQTIGDRTVLNGKGTVTTSDGFVGPFNRTFLFKGDDILLMRFHDTELNSATGQRMVFSMGMYLVVTPDGKVAVDAELYGGGSCVGF